MTLDDLYEEMDFAESIPDLNKDAGTPCCVTVKGAVLPNDETDFDFDDEDDDDDPEEQLLQSLALLEDCLCVLEEIIDPTQRTITQKVLGRAEDAALQARAWLFKHEGTDR